MGATTADVKSIFGKALDLPTPAERAAYLDEACGDNSRLRAEVESLLKAGQQAGGFFEGLGPASATTIEEPIREGPGTVIGPYKLLEQIGEGGFGLVFMAEQQQPIRRKVALKILKPGMDTRQVIARFEAERQALALMDHPNIAKVLEGGETTSGRPYFVMDLVKGLPITEYCDQSQLTPKERLELFVNVCQAVQHAHQKGIIHRDIKPSNVLVTLHDGVPVPKIIDFGIAKALGQQLTDKTLFTQFAQLIGTPLYMSPEQAEMSGLDIDTRTDIYSLGVLLYELLTGTTPFDKERLHRAGYDEIRRIVREEEPPKPSTRISTLGQAATTASANRKSDPKRLSQLFRGELDWIVMKCLEKDRNRRYETVNGLAMDVRRYLHDEPVLACPPSTGYRLRKFARRNKGALTTAALLAAALLLTIVILAISNVLVMRERDRKDQALKEKAEALIQATANEQAAMAQRRYARQAVDKMFTQVAQKWLAQRPGLETLQREFLEEALRFYQEFAKEQGSAADVRLETGLAFIRSATIQNALDKQAKWEEGFNQGTALLEELVAEFPSEPGYRSALAESYWVHGTVYIGTDRPQEGVRLVRRSRLLRNELVAEFPDVPDHRRQLSKSLCSLTILLNHAGQSPEAVEAGRAALQLFEKLPPDLAKTSDCRWDLCITMSELSDALFGSGQSQQGEEYLQRAVTLYERLVADFPYERRYQVDLACNLLVWGRRMQGTRPQESEKAFRKGLALSENGTANLRPGGDSYPQWVRAECCSSLVEFLKRANRPLEAVEVYYKAIELYQQRLVQSPTVGYYRTVLADSHRELVRLLKPLGRTEDAEKAFRQTVSIWQKLAADFPTADNQGRVGSWYEELGHLLKEASRFEDAGDAYRKALEVWERLYADSNKSDHWKHLTFNHGWLIEVLLCRAGQVENDRKLSEADRKVAAQEYRDKARQLVKKAGKRGLDMSQTLNNAAWNLATNARNDSRDPARAVELAKLAVEEAPDNGSFLNTLGAAYYRAGEWKTALATLKQADDIHGSSLFSYDAFFIAMAAWQAGDKEGARKWYVAAARWLEEKAPKNEELLRFRAEAVSLLGLPVHSPADKQKPPDHRELYTLILNANPEAAWAYVERAQIEKSQGDAQKADADFGRAIALYTRAIQHKPGDGLRWFNRGNAYAQLGQWDKASADLAKASVATDAGLGVWYRHALLRLQCGDLEGYRKACAVIVERFGKMTGGASPNLGAWSCVLAPEALDDYAGLVQWAETLAGTEPRDVAPLGTLGAALYRAGRFDDALKRLQEADASYKPAEEQRTAIAYVWCFLAMDHYRLGHAAEARQWLDKAVNQIDGRGVKADAASAASVPWNRRLTLRLLRREAEELLNGKKSGD